MKKVKLIIILGLFFVGLVLIRAFENTLFYDPLIDYFKGNYLNTNLTEIEYVKYFGHILYRYSLNTALSLGIIHLLFKDSRILKFSLNFYILLFIILTSFLIILFQIIDDKMLMFYVRRFLIQPIFLFILAPAFYYQKLKKK